MRSAGDGRPTTTVPSRRPRHNIARLTVSEVPATGLKYHGNHISLGQWDAIFRMVDGDVRAKSWYLGGRTAAWLKSGVFKGGRVGHRPPDLRHAEAQAPLGHRA